MASTILYKQDLLDLLDAVSIAAEDLDYRQDLDVDYEPEDIANMEAKRDRLNKLFPILAEFTNKVASAKPGKSFVLTFDA